MSISIFSPNKKKYFYFHTIRIFLLLNLVSFFRNVFFLIYRINEIIGNFESQSSIRLNNCSFLWSNNILFFVGQRIKELSLCHKLKFSNFYIVET